MNAPDLPVQSTPRPRVSAADPTASPSASPIAGLPHTALPAGLLALLALLTPLATASPLPAPQGPAKITPVPFTAVRVDDAFWSPRLLRNRQVTLQHNLQQCRESGRIANFLVAAGKQEGGMTGYYFNDSDVYKVLEGAAHVLATGRDEALERQCDEIIAAIAGAQEPDGYLYCARSILDPDNMPPGGKERWSDVANGHELYCAGHLYEAAVAYAAATGKRQLLEVALRNADLVLQQFGPAGDPRPPGHPEIELGLLKLHQHTGDARYLQLARWFLDARGYTARRRLYGDYAQDHRPILDQDAIVGHAVRACYLFAATTDIARLTGDDDYLRASQRLWEDMARSQVYLTGGVGSSGSNEGFGHRYELPNLTGYGETCASIANAMWSWRLFLATGQARYLDMVERVVFNGFLAGWSLSGDRFFYPNPLASRGADRQAWFNCACCPPNVTRFVPQLPGMVYAAGKGALYVNLFVGCAATVPVDGQAVAVNQRTRYPWDGQVRLELGLDEPREFEVRLRIPSWSRDEPMPGGLYRFADDDTQNRRLTVNGTEVLAHADRGFAVVARRWQDGDVLEWTLPMPARRVVCDERVETNRGMVALQRGPLVYCLEGSDQPAPEVDSYVLSDDAAITAEHRPDLLGGVTVLRTRAAQVHRTAAGALEQGEPGDALAIPYFAWANRGSTPMAVWLARTAAAAKPPEPATGVGR